MRRLILGCLVLGGCTKENPAWEGSGSDAGPGTGSSSAAPGTSSTAPASTDDPGPTDGSATASGDETTDAVIMSTGGETSMGAQTTGGTSTGEDPGTSTGAPAKSCLAWETIPLPLPPVHDTGVVPDSLNDALTCPWGGMTCGDLNFGATHFYRLVNDAKKGRNAALLRFPITSLEEVSESLGHELADLVGLRISVVFWENTPVPATPYTVEIRALRPENLGWTEGGRNAAPAQEGDSSNRCRTVQGDCEQWHDDESPLEGSELLGVIEVDADKAEPADMDRLGDQYHAPILSERLEGALELYGHEVMPGFALALTTPRDLDQTVVGIKFKEVPDWDDPTLHGDFCTKWSE